MFRQKEGTKCHIKNPTKRFKRPIKQNRQTGKVGDTWLQQDDPQTMMVQPMRKTQLCKV